MLLLLPMLTIAQTENRMRYTIDSYHNRSCLGGLGTCPKNKIIGSDEKTTASVAKTEKNILQLSLDKIGFTAQEWEELAGKKIFPIDESIKVDDELLRFLSIDIKFNTIKQGLYPVVVLEDKAIVVLELVTRN